MTAMALDRALVACPELLYLIYSNYNEFGIEEKKKRKGRKV